MSGSCLITPLPISALFRPKTDVLWILLPGPPLESVLAETPRVVARLPLCPRRIAQGQLLIVFLLSVSFILTCHPQACPNNTYQLHPKAALTVTLHHLKVTPSLPLAMYPSHLTIPLKSTSPVKHKSPIVPPEATPITKGTTPRPPPRKRGEGRR